MQPDRGAWTLTLILWLMEVLSWCLLPFGLLAVLGLVVFKPWLEARELAYRRRHAGDPAWFWSGYSGWVRHHPLRVVVGEGWEWLTPDGKPPCH